MRQPEGFDDGTDRVARLLQSLYGLKQAARCWYKLLHKELLAVGYTQLVLDTAVYIQRVHDFIIILAIHVDNILSFGNDKARLAKARAKLHTIFEMKEEDPDWVMGFKLVKNQEEATISINHSQYISAVL